MSFTKTVAKYNDVDFTTLLQIEGYFKTMLSKTS